MYLKNDKGGCMHLRIGIVFAICAGTAHAQNSYQLGDATSNGIGVPSSDVEWSSLGKINWREYSVSSSNWPSPWFPGGSLSAFFSGVAPADRPIMVPYGDVLGYTGAGVGDVDGDGYGDFALTWYESDKDRGDPCGNHPPAWTSDPANTVSTVVSQSTMERIGFVRVMSGDPDAGTSGVCQDIDSATGDTDTLGIDSLGNPVDYIRRIGAPISVPVDPGAHSDFWGSGNGGLWSHEITSLGDIDGDGRDEMMLSANVGLAGVVQIWAYTDRYSKSGASPERWVKLLEITGSSVSGVTGKQEEFGYQSHEGSPPNPGLGVSFSRDFNADGQTDLLIASKFFRDSALGHVVDTSTGARSFAPGAAWIFMLPQPDVFSEIDSVSTAACDTVDNRHGAAGSDDITDLLPLRYTTDDYSVRIVGHQRWQTGEPTDKYPRHFGYEICPAGDIDGDELLDLAVAAPFHYTEAEYDDYVSNSTDFTDFHNGRVYFFLSDSPNREGGAGPTFADLHPKFYYNPNLIGLRFCSGTAYSYSVFSANMSSNQIAFESDVADYVFEGGAASGSFDFAPFAGQMIGGTNLDGDSDPDFVVMQNSANRFYVFEDIQSAISTTPSTSPQQVLWDSAQSTWNTGLFSGSTANFFVCNSGLNSTDANGVPHVGVRSMGSNYAGIIGVSMGGDQDGDGDCELFVGCHAIWNPSIQDRIATLAVKLTNSSPALALHAEYIPEPFVWEDTDMSDMGGGNYVQQNLHNNGQSEVKTQAMAAWPVWNPSGQSWNQTGIDDVLLGKRTFPRRIEKYPNAALTAWVSIPGYTGSTQPEGLAYDKMTLVPAGKAYFVRSSGKVTE
jgi:hypothetical protein